MICQHFLAHQLSLWLVYFMCVPIQILLFQGKRVGYPCSTSSSCVLHCAGQSCQTDSRVLQITLVKCSSPCISISSLLRCQSTTLCQELFVPLTVHITHMSQSCGKYTGRTTCFLANLKAWPISLTAHALPCIHL